jgi:hypothetical protein
MDRPVLLQEDPERFRVLLGGGREVQATLPHAARRGLGLHGVPPLTVATELVAFLLERDALPEREVALVPAAARFPGFFDELRARLT